MEKIICKNEKCNKFIMEPVNLPCGNCVCKEHIDELLAMNIQSINCPFYCENETHEIPNDGFPICIPLQSVLSLNMHLNQDQKKARQLVDALKIEKDNFDKILKDPQGFVFDYALEVRNKIDLERERLIQDIHEISDEMLHKVKAFENESNEKIKSKKHVETNNENSKYLNDLNEKLKSFDGGLRVPKLPEEKLKNLIKEFNKIKQENDEKCQSYKNNLLNEKKCEFKAGSFKFDSNLFGSLWLEDFKQFSNSRILENKSQVESLLKLCEFDENIKFELIYQASVDGFDSEDFHRKCDGQAKTLTIIKEKKHSFVFGGFTENAWDSSSLWKKDKNALIFSLINKENNPLKMKIKPDAYSTYNHSGCGPSFGEDIVILNNSNINEYSYSNLGWNYIHPIYAKGSTEAKTFLAGSYKFSTSEIEVYKIME